MVIKNEYFGDIFLEEREDLETVLELYTKIAEKQGFEPDAEHVEDMLDSEPVMTTVLYHVEGFGKGLEGYEEVKYMFE